MIEALRWTDEDERVLDELQAAGPADHAADQQGRSRTAEGSRLLPFIAGSSAKADFARGGADLGH